MSSERFKLGKLYFIGGYRDPGRTLPRSVRPVIYIGKEEATSAEGFNTYSFEDLEAWSERRGIGVPDPNDVQLIEGPPDVRHVMDLEELIEELKKLRQRLDKDPRTV